LHNFRWLFSGIMLFGLCAKGWFGFQMGQSWKYNIIMIPWLFMYLLFHLEI
jgi:hypothetical protein